MATELDAVIDENGELRAKVPKGTQPGARRILLLPPAPEQPGTAGDDARPWADEELKALLDFQPVPAEEIVTGGWDEKNNERPWTESEIQQMLVSHPKTGAEIAKSEAIGGWAHMGIADSVAFVEELRRKRKERRWHRD